VGVRLGGRDFRLLVLSTGLTSLGDELALIALTIKVAELTDSGLAVAALLLAGLLPLVIFAPAAGVIVDNFETRRSLVIASGVQALLAVWLAFAGGLPAILMLSFLLGTCTAVASPAIYTLAPAIVGDEHATEGNAYLETARYVGMIAGPVLAGVLSAAIDTRVALLVDAATFVAIGLAALALRVRRPPVRTEEGGGEARAGFGLVGRDRLLLIAFAVIGAVVLFAAMDNVAEVFYAREDLDAGAWGYGLLASLWLVGMVIGAVAIARRLGKERLLPALAIAAVVGGAAVAVAGLIPVLVVALAMFVVGGVGNGIETVSMRSIIVHRVPDRFRGRVFAAYGGLMNGMQIAATGVAGVLVGAVGGRTALIIGGVGSAVAGLSGLVAYRALPSEARAMAPEEAAMAGEEGRAASDAAEEAPAEEAPAEEPAAGAPTGAPALRSVPLEPSQLDAADGNGDAVPDRPDVTLLPESEPIARRAADS
jgi:MFS family permease